MKHYTLYSSFCLIDKTSFCTKLHMRCSMNAYTLSLKTYNEALKDNLEYCFYNNPRSLIFIFPNICIPKIPSP